MQISAVTDGQTGQIRPFLSSVVPLFQNGSKCETFRTKISACNFIFMEISHFHKNGFALELALKQRPS